MDQDTVYTALGDWPGWLSLFAFGWMLIARRAAER